MARRIDRLTRWPEPYRLWISARRRRTWTCSPSGLVVMSQKVSASASGRGAGANCQAQVVGRTAYFSLDYGAGVMRDQAAQHLVGVVDVAQVAGAVQAVQAGDGQFGEVADVVQPGGGLQQPGVGADGGCEAAGPGGDALDVSPAAGHGSFEQGAGEAFGPRGQCLPSPP